MRPIGETFPLSPSQLDVLIEQSISPDVPMHNVGLYFPVRGRIDFERFAQAVREVVHGSDALSATLTGQADVPEQRLLDGDIPLIHRHCATEMDARAWMAEDFDRPFQLYGGWLFRFALLEVGSGGGFFYTAFHHLIVDAASVLLMIQRIADAYGALERQERFAADLPPYRDFIREDTAYWRSERFAEDRAFWIERYADLPDQLAPHRDLAGDGAGERRAARVPFTLGRETLSRLKQALGERKVTNAQIFTALLYGFCARFFGLDDLAIGMARLNRTDAFRATIGTFANISPVRIRRAASFTQAVTAIQDDLAAVWPHRHFPTSALNRALNLLERGREQLFDVSIAYIQGGQPDLALGADVALGAPQILTSGYDRGAIQAFVADNPGEPLAVELICSRRYFRDDQLERLPEQLAGFFDAVAANPDAPL
ncbi:MAG TPA: condensation domain-containing protein, partial [Caulobacter sp.]|nr:condensation domain-containing protein [Caulobacter sp.]